MHIRSPLCIVQILIYNFNRLFNMGSSWAYYSKFHTRSLSDHSNLHQLFCRDITFQNKQNFYTHCQIYNCGLGSNFVWLQLTFYKKHAFFFLISMNFYYLFEFKPLYLHFILRSVLDYPYRYSTTHAYSFFSRVKGQ